MDDIDNLKLDMTVKGNAEALAAVANAGLYLAGSLKRSGILAGMKQGSDLHVACLSMELAAVRLMGVVNQIEVNNKAAAEKQQHEDVNEALGSWYCLECGQQNYQPKHKGCCYPGCPTNDPKPVNTQVTGTL